MPRAAISRQEPPRPRLPTSVLRRRPADVVVTGTPAPRPAPAQRPAALAQPPAGPAQHPAGTTQHPARTTQHRAGTTQHPARSTQHPARTTQHPADRPGSRFSAPGVRGPARGPARLAVTGPPGSTAPPVRPGRRPMPLGLMAAVLVFVGLFALGAGLGAATGYDLRELFQGPDKPPPRAFPVLNPSEPKRLIIPSIGVKAPIMQVALAKDGSVDVPPLKRHNEVGWFDQGPTPGQFGPALIVGHADTRTGPSVFHHLGRLKPGQKIEVLRADDSVAVFQINSVERFSKQKLPRKRVYGDYSRPSLRLMTCGGRWLGGEQGYSDNVVVFASLVNAEET